MKKHDLVLIFKLVLFEVTLRRMPNDTVPERAQCSKITAAKARASALVKVSCCICFDDFFLFFFFYTKFFGIAFCLFGVIFRYAFSVFKALSVYHQPRVHAHTLTGLLVPYFEQRFPLRHFKKSARKKLTFFCVLQVIEEGMEKKRIFEHFSFLSSIWASRRAGLLAE